MKKSILIIFVIFTVVFVNAQSGEEIASPAIYNPAADTLTKRNAIGINIYPALGVFGGSRMPNMKISLQYKYMWDRMNLKGSLNYSDFYKAGSTYVDGIESYVINKPEGPESVDSIVFRHHINKIYSYDARVGAEAAFRQRNATIFVGGDLIFGVLKTNEEYTLLKKQFENGMIVPAGSGFENNGDVRFRDLNYLKLGLDLTIGVDFNIGENVMFTVQYSPEFVYYKNTKESVYDPDGRFSERPKDGFEFVPYFIDLILAIRF